MRRVYLDHAATTPVDPEVAELMAQVLREVPGNPSSIYAEGRQARALVDRARAEVAGAIGAEPSEIVFTSGGTEAEGSLCSPAGVACPFSGELSLGGVLAPFGSSVDAIYTRIDCLALHSLRFHSSSAVAVTVLRRWLLGAGGGTALESRDK